MTAEPDDLQRRIGIRTALLLMKHTADQWVAAQESGSIDAQLQAGQNLHDVIREALRSLSGD